MKRILIVVFCLWALIALTGCQEEAKPSSVPKSTPVPTYLPETQDKTTTPSEKTEEPTSSIDNTKPTPSPYVTVDWQTISYRWEDNSGYKFEATIKISPWINTKNEEYLKSAWAEVGGRNQLTTANAENWGLTEGSNGYSRGNDEYCSFRPIKNITDIYYCVGEITIKNLTEGWDITSSSPVTSNPLWISPCQPETQVEEVRRHPSLEDNYTRSETVSKVYFSDGQKANPTWARISPKYTSNQWGPVSFVFAHFDNKTPAAPNGEFISEITDTYFCVNGIDFCIWIKEMAELSTLKLNIVE